MQNETLYPTCSGIKKTPIQILGDFLYQTLVLCIAFPLACLVMVGRGIRLTFSFIMNLSFKCCMWICLGTIIVLFLLAVIVQLSVASIG